MNIKTHLKVIAFFMTIVCCTYLAITFPIGAAVVMVAAVFLCAYHVIYITLDHYEE